MEGKYTRKLLRKLKKELPEDANVKVVFAPTIRPSLKEYYRIWIDEFNYTVFEVFIEREGIKAAVEIISSLYLEDRMNEILGGRM